MYRIGQFSQYCKVTVKALRFYEEEGLLVPAHIDAATGYRYYESSQLPQAHKIVALKQCGFSIPEIRELLAGREVAAIFAQRRRRLVEELGTISSQLSSIESYIASLDASGEIGYEVVVKDLRGGIFYSKRLVAPSYDSYFDLIPQIGRDCLEANPEIRCIEDPPYCFIEYHDGEYRDRDIDIELHEAVDRMGVETDTIKFKRLPRVSEAACVLHKGPYSELRGAYAAVFRWIDGNGYEAAGNPRESYIDGIWNEGDPADWLTEVQVPVRRRE